MTIDGFAKETAKDKTLTTVIQVILNNKRYGVKDGRNKATFHTLLANSTELSLAYKGSIIHKGHLIILSKTLKKVRQK